MADSFLVRGKIAIVTGAGSGIGRGIAEVLANNGAKVVVVDLDGTKAKSTAEKIRLAGNISTSMAADVSSWADMQKMAVVVVKEYGRIDILCENAGIYPPSKILEMSEEQWDKVIDVNLKGCFLGLKSCLPQMLKQNYGRVIMTSSITGYRTGEIGLSHYSASKAGIIGFMRSAALEVAKNNITVNAIEPGSILTEGTSRFAPEEIMKQEEITPTGRLSSPEDIGNAVLFLASDLATNITGQTIVVDGGFSIVEN
jgi:3-oxoacyl-[acyl-carrier protein] reductase